MGSFSDYAELKILDHLLGDVAFTMPAAYIGLSTTSVADDGTGVTEPVGGSYARKATTGADWNAAAAGAKDNANTITFPQATGNWGTILDFVIFDALSNGNVLAYGTLDISKAINNGDTASFAAGSLNITLN